MSFGTSKTIKYFKRLKIYKNSTGNVTFDPETFEARSYNWWVFVKKINNKVVFNDYSYSVSTNAHQWLVKRVLIDLGIKIDVTVYMHDSLSNFKEHALPSLYEKIYDLEIVMNRKGTNKEKNQDRQSWINDAKQEIKVCRSLGAVFTKKQMQDLKTRLNTNETDRMTRMKQDNEDRKLLRARQKELIQSQNVFDLKELGA